MFFVFLKILLYHRFCLLSLFYYKNNEFHNYLYYIEYILYKSFQSCIKIYVKFNRLVITIRNNDTIPDIETIKNLANQMNIENIQINIRP